MSKVTNRTWRALDACEVAGVELGTFSAWRMRLGFLNGDRRGKASRFSMLDVAVTVLMATLTRRGYNARDAAGMAEHHRPTLQKALTDLVELGRIRHRPRLTLEQDAKGGLEHIAPVTFDLAALAEWVVAKLAVPISTKRPTKAEAKAMLAYIASNDFAEKLAALKVEIDKRTPRTWTWADVEDATGLPEWFALWALDSPRTDAFRMIERVRDDMPEVHA
ncbi:hypothetical protein [Methyloceanibacter caenitepidi]|uniref:Uncharacterized protein n=1 Tax=Methyloceanibacter caenitepidi TaxID=1384459 RepID=A0A0A8K3X9_9HYPH|nr:hypothetical protein [Methyloceanibacter caenitepidi]BAQ17476.1 hypothetical protein GL4_2029 [Methyloceanibacter caenitepidi]